MSKERPILFSAPMVRALLDGSKTQTRRIVKLPHQNSLGQWEPTTIGGELGGRTAAGDEIAVQGAIWHTRTGDCLASPYGQPGDLLWVRETHRPIWGQTPGYLINVDYRADPREKWERLGDQIGAPTKWTPSIHMRREYSRILLEIVSVRVEQLHDLSETDAIAEGIEQMPCDVPNTRLWRNYRPENGWTPRVCIPQNSFRSLWETINSEVGWLANPWVWVVEFRRIEA